MSNLAVYIHWPFCKAKCPYCDFNSHVRDKIEQDRWRKAMLRELEYMHQYAPDFTVSSIFFGGGTPSLMPAVTVQAMVSRIHELWKTTKNIEITLEANPTSVEADIFKEFRDAGVNRISLGVQSLRDSELKFLGRGHNVKEAIAAIELAGKIFDRYSFDLIYARPQQTVKDWDVELSEALTLAGDHLSLYQLTIEENTAFYHIYAKGNLLLPDENLAEELYLFTEEKMSSQGYIAYEVSNYARDGQEVLHNLSYWNGSSYIGIGAGAHGRIQIDGKRVATQTLKSPERWLETVEKQSNALEIWQEISPQTEVEERVMMGLRLRNGINYQQFIEQTGYDLQEYINLEKRDFYVQRGLLEDSKTTLKTTLKGRLLLNKLTAELL